MCYMFSLCVFKQMGLPSSPSCIHSFKHSLAVKLFSHNQILINPKSNGLVHNVCVKNMCFLYGVCRFIDLSGCVLHILRFFESYVPCDLGLLAGVQQEYIDRAPLAASP